MFDARKAEALLAVLHTGSFEQAAQSLHLTPSAVSQRIGSLEAELGTPLLTRGKPCRPTPMGQQVLQYLLRSRQMEAELMAEIQPQQNQFVSVGLAVNNDTLATWLLPALGEFLIEEKILLDIMLDDQDYTFKLLTQGLALAGISSAAEPMRGCQTIALGSMRYRLLATPAFARRWFPHGLQREAARTTPLVVFDRKDSLQSDFLAQHLGLPPGSYPQHFIPASDAFFKAVCMGLGYGFIPLLQYGDAIINGTLIDLAPAQAVDVNLYWHTWKVQSLKLERLSQRLFQAAQTALRQC
jgi:LysR family transcriptional regulator (chromosome initiation inhibitor)